MARKSHYIKALSERDYKAFQILWNCQHAERRLLPITDNRLRNYEKEGIVKVGRDTQNRIIVERTTKGAKLMGRLPTFAGRRPYQNTPAPNHNVRLAEVYAKLSDEEQTYYRNEAELYRYTAQYEHYREERREHYKEWKEERELSVCDGCVIDHKGEIQYFIEVVTDSYGRAEIQAKEAYAESFGIEVKMIQ